VLCCLTLHIKDRKITEKKKPGSSCVARQLPVGQSMSPCPKRTWLLQGPHCRERRKASRVVSLRTSTIYEFLKK